MDHDFDLDSFPKISQKAKMGQNGAYILKFPIDLPAMQSLNTGSDYMEQT